MWMRKLRKANFKPVILLSNVYMPTQYGGRQRPHFPIVRFINWDDQGGGTEMLPKPEAPALAAPADSPVESTAARVIEPSDIKTVDPPSRSEEMGGDSVPW